MQTKIWSTLTSICHLLKGKVTYYIMKCKKHNTDSSLNDTVDGADPASDLRDLHASGNLLSREDAEEYIIQIREDRHSK